MCYPLLGGVSLVKKEGGGGGAVLNDVLCFIRFHSQWVESKGFWVMSFPFSVRMVFCRDGAGGDLGKEEQLRFHHHLGP